MGQLNNIPIPVKQMNFATGTWTYVPGASGTPENQLKTATAETSTVTVPFKIFGHPDFLGAQLKKVTVPISVGTADLTGVIVGSLFQHNTYKAEYIPAFTFTADIVTQLFTTTAAFLPDPGTAVQVSTSSALPGGLAVSTTYFIGNINTTLKTFQLFTSQALAVAASTPIVITTTGVGTQTLTVNNVDTVAIPGTEKGTQVTASGNIRRYEFNVTNPFYSGAAAPANLFDIVDYTLSLSIPAAASSVVRVYGATALAEVANGL